jgi:arsenite methyltransferase
MDDVTEIGSGRPGRASGVIEQVRAHYREAARAVSAARDEETCCGPAGCCGDARMWGGSRYEQAVLADAPDTAILASLGCGNPTAVAELSPGETVLDLGSGGGLDVLLSAKRVGPTGKAYGLDMTEEMLALAIENRERAGVTNAEFLLGYIEEIPLPGASVDVVISNCVVNLSADKHQVFAETFRVLRPGGRLAITDVVSDVPFAERAARGVDPEDWAGCLGGALGREEYRSGLFAAGFEDVQIVDSHPVGNGFWSAIIRAGKPS